jgi:hypothetical protein
MYITLDTIKLHGWLEEQKKNEEPDGFWEFDEFG